MLSISYLMTWGRIPAWGKRPISSIRYKWRQRLSSWPRRWRGELRRVPISGRSAGLMTRKARNGARQKQVCGSVMRRGDGGNMFLSICAYVDNTYVVKSNQYDMQTRGNLVDDGSINLLGRPIAVNRDWYDFVVWGGNFQFDLICDGAFLFVRRRQKFLHQLLKELRQL